MDSKGKLGQNLEALKLLALQSTLSDPPNMLSGLHEEFH